MKVEIEIVSKEVISYLDRHELEGSPYDSEINRLLEIGVAVVERVEVNRDVEFVKKEVEKMTSQFNNSLGMLFADVENNNAQKSLKFTVQDVAIDTCTYSSGDWNVNCEDNCIISSSVN